MRINDKSKHARVGVLVRPACVHGFSVRELTPADDVLGILRLAIALVSGTWEARHLPINPRAQNEFSGLNIAQSYVTPALIVVPSAQIHYFCGMGDGLEPVDIQTFVP